MKKLITIATLLFFLPGCTGSESKREASMSEELDVSNTVETVNIIWNNSKFLNLKARYSKNSKVNDTFLNAKGFQTADINYPIWQDYGDYSLAFFIGVNLQEFNEIAIIKNKNSTCFEIQSSNIPIVHCAFKYVNN